ncbi:MAG: RraA family protein [Acidimicrobiales bacterium]|nr:RraA family protein [Acidimicrobiales bacterium]
MPPTTALADVLLMGGSNGWISPPLEPIVTSPQPVAARVVTVELAMVEDGAGLGPLFSILNRESVGGRILVIGGAPSMSGAVWGEILGAAARNAGVRGVVLDGTARDVAALHELALPTWARAQGTVGPGRSVEVVGVGDAVQVGDVHIDGGDLVVMDDGGVVALHADIEGEVLARARRYAEAEAAVVDDLRGGRPLVDAYEHKRQTVASLRELEGFDS